jgi:hypothetical protein
MASKCTKDAENIYAPLVMVSIEARKRTLATFYRNGSIDTSSDPPLFSLDCTVNLVFFSKNNNARPPMKQHEIIALEK